ncbi:MAG: hypothetical protein CL878_02060 [Dehalococcoidia bacterium]|nr:hypothetical protein [Dehalococcoidia bacterium]
MSTDTYCPRCRIGRLDDEGFCPLCGGIGSHVGRRKRWALTIGQLLGNLNLGLVALGLFLASATLVIWVGSSWLAPASSGSALVPAVVSELLARSRSDPGGLLLDLIWRALVQATIATAIIVAVGYTLWKRQQRRSRVERVTRSHGRS